MHLPDGRHREHVEIISVVIHSKEAILQIVDAVKVAELPVAVQETNAVGLGAVMDEIVHSAGGRNVIGSGRHGVLMQNAHVFIMLGDDHVGILLVMSVIGLSSEFCFPCEFIVTIPTEIEHKRASTKHAQNDMFPQTKHKHALL